MREIGIIKEKKDKNKVIIDLKIVNDCVTCSLSKNCITKKNECENLIEVICEDKVEIGDKVIVNISIFKKIFFLFLIFIFPLFIIFISYYLFYKVIKSDLFLVLLLFFILTLYFIIIIAIYKFKPSFLTLKCHKIKDAD